MNLKQLFFRSKTLTSVIQVETWEVRWVGRHDAISYAVEMQVKVFISEPEAQEFVAALKEAQKLLNYTEDIRIRLTKGN